MRKQGRERSLKLWMARAFWVAFAAVLPAPALAIPEVKLVWTDASGGVVGGVGTSSIVVSNTEVSTLTLEIQMHIFPPPCCPLSVSLLCLSLEYDRDRRDELDVASFEVARGGPLFPLTSGILSSQESTRANEGQLYGFWLGTTLGRGVGNVSFPVGRVTFTTDPKNIDSDFDDDVFSLVTLDDGIFTDRSIDVSSQFQFGTARVTDQVGAILAFFDASVEAGTLTGAGPSEKASAGRLSALRNMIRASRAIDEGCNQLANALTRTDGETPPPDFVTGEAAGDLAAEIEALRMDIGCE